MAEQKSEYPSILYEPILWDGPSEKAFSFLNGDNSELEYLFGESTFSEEELNEKRKDIAQQVHNAERRLSFRRLHKLDILARHYGLETDGNMQFLMLKLCFLLFEEKFPSGLKWVFNKKRKGRKKKWDSDRYSQLIAQIEEIKREINCGDAHAIKIHLQRSGNKRPSPSDIRSLNARLVEARDPENNFFWKWLLNGNEKPSEHRLKNFIEYHSPQK